MMDLENAVHNPGSAERKKRVTFWSPEDMINPQTIHQQAEHQQNLMHSGPPEPLRNHHSYPTFDDTSTLKYKVEQGTSSSLEATPSPSKKPKKEIDSTKAYKCQQCEYSFNRRDHLTRHSLVHTKLKPFHCVYCNKDFTRNDHLRRHQQRVHGEETGAATTEISQRFICQHCKAIFSSSGHLRVHIENKHQNDFNDYMGQKDQPPRKIEANNVSYVFVDGKKRPVCGLCGKSFSKSDHLRRHINNVHAGMTASTFPDFNPEQTFVCPFTECSKSFSRHDFLRRHLDDVHQSPAHQSHSNPMMNIYNNQGNTSTALEPSSVFPVPPMGMFGVSSSFENSPMMSDPPKTPKASPTKEHKCSICNKMFSRRYHLTRHQKSLHGGVYDAQ